jgi:hypothetical protein
MPSLTFIELSNPDGDRLLSAACTLGPEEMRTRLREWTTLRDRSVLRQEPDGVVLTLPDNTSIAALADLVERESECCGFYTFTLTIDGPARELRISAGAGREAAVQALLGLTGAEGGSSDSD